MQLIECLGLTRTVHQHLGAFARQPNHESDNEMKISMTHHTWYFKRCVSWAERKNQGPGNLHRRGWSACTLASPTAEGLRKIARIKVGNCLYKLVFLYLHYLLQILNFLQIHFLQFPLAYIDIFSGQPCISGLLSCQRKQRKCSRRKKNWKICNKIGKTS